MLSDLHNHSIFSDGFNTCEELVEQAVALGLKRIGLVEHVWRHSEWVPEFINYTHWLKDKYKGVIQIVTGLEAKALTCTGEIDFNEMWKSKVDYVLGAIHRIPARSKRFYSSNDNSANKVEVYEDWLLTMEGMLTNRMVDIIAHPGAELIRYQISLPSQVKEMLCQLGKGTGKIFEVNVKHQVPDKEFLSYLLKYHLPLSIASDSHSTTEQRKYIKDIITTHHSLAAFNLI